MFKKALFVLGLSLLAGCAASPASTLKLSSQTNVLKTRAVTPNTVVAPVSVMNSIYVLMKNNQAKYGDLTYCLTAYASRDGFKTSYASATEVVDPENANLEGGLTFRLFNNRKLGKPSAGDYSYYILIEASSPQKKSVPTFSLGKGGTLKCQMK